MKRLELLDYGRFFAAISVILFHYTFNGIINGKIGSITHIPPVIELTKYGYLGVEFFFMISGYAIFFSAKNRTASEFAANRATRLYPAYWFAVLFTSFFALQWGGDLMSVYPAQIAANLTMLQGFLGIGHVDGAYWTLVYEITFYFAVFLILLLGFQKHLESIFKCWPILFCAAILLDKHSLPYLGNYYYYFSAGALFAILKERLDWRAAFSLLISYILCIIFSTGRASELTVSKGVEYSPLIIGLIVTAFFLLFAYQNTNKGQSLKLPLSRTAGNLTYPLYLIHAHFGYILIGQLATEENKIVIYVFTVFLALTIAFILHKIIEVRFSHFWALLFNITIARFVSFLQDAQLKVQAAYQKRIN